VLRGTYEKPSNIVLRSGDEKWKDYAGIVINSVVAVNKDEVITQQLKYFKT
jgi:hypothetical protein